MGAIFFETKPSPLSEKTLKIRTPLFDTFPKLFQTGVTTLILDGGHYIHFNATWSGDGDFSEFESPPIHTSTEQSTPYCLSFAYATRGVFHSPPLSVYVENGEMRRNVLWKVPQVESVRWRVEKVQVDIYDKDQVDHSSVIT